MASSYRRINSYELRKTCRTRSGCYLFTIRTSKVLEAVDKSDKKGASAMRRFLFIATAFFMQSCYTIFYTPDEYADYNGVNPNHDEPGIIFIESPDQPCPPPAEVIIVPVTTQDNSSAVSAPPRVRTQGVTRASAVPSQPGNPDERHRTSSPAPPAVSPAPQGNANSQSSAVRERTGPQPQQPASPRERPE